LLAKAMHTEKEDCYATIPNSAIALEMTVSNPKDKKPITDHGKYLTVFKKQPDGSWKMVADMINSDLPLPGVAQ
jgi:ketosteroid isomerase-like protein